MRFLSLVLIILLVGVTACAIETLDESVATPTLTPAPTQRITLSINAHAEVKSGSDFYSRVTVTDVTDFAVSQFDLAYDPAVIVVIGKQGNPQAVTSGIMGGIAIPVE